VVTARIATLLTLALPVACACSNTTDPSDATASETSSSASTGKQTSPQQSASAAAELPVADTPVVGLAGVTTVAGPLPEGAARVAAVRWLTRVHGRADRDAKVLGFLRAGAVVQARSATRGATKGCKGGWRGIEPAGFVCMSDMTEDMDNDVARATSRRPDFSHRLPYMYGTVTRGGPVYARIPSSKQLKKYEPNLSKHLRKWRDDEVNGARYGLDVWLRYTDAKSVPSALDALEDRVTDEHIPWFLKDGGTVPALSRRVKGDAAVKVDQVDRRQGRSFTHSFLHEGRRYNVTPDLVVIPADRFRPIRGSAFHGWQVDEELTFPFAIVRRKGAKKWIWSNSNKRMTDGGKLDYRSVWPLTGKQQFFKKKLHYQTKEGFYIDDRHGSRVDPAKRWPKWAKQGAKWMDVNITKQVLVAYEGKKMVYATLVSSGEAGLGDPDKTTATKTGIFRVHTKHVSVTMDSDVVGEEFELRDVPYVQYFEGGYALHGAYWHDTFGRPKSHGCINLAPEDARRLFFWTEPSVPSGWHGARTALNGTIVFVHP
jgi:hypothetical protein